MYFHIHEYFGEFPSGVYRCIHEQGEQLQAHWTSCESSVLKLLTPEPQMEQEIMGRKVTINTAANMHAHIAHNSLI